MSYISNSFDCGFDPLARINLKAMTASIAAHVAVFAVFAATWADTVKVQESRAPALVSIDFSSREGGPALKAHPISEPEKSEQALNKPSVETPAHTVKAQSNASSSPSVRPLPPPTSPALGGGGEGRTGQGSAAVTVQSTTLTKLVTPPVAVPQMAAQTGAIDAQSPPARIGTSSKSHSGHGGSSAHDERGNGDVSNYKGRVYKHLLRYKQGNTIGSGEALVGFTIEPNGSAQSASVVRTSGVSRFDREALAMVRRASPFPRPPDSSSHRFTFEITGQ